MELKEFLDHVNRGLPVDGASEMQQYMTCLAHEGHAHYGAPERRLP